MHEAMQHNSRDALIIKLISTQDDVLVKIFGFLLSCTECPYCSKVEMAIPTLQLDNNTYHMHLIIRSDISTLDKTQIPLDLFFDAILNIEQVCHFIFTAPPIIHITSFLVPPLRQSKISQL